MTIVLTIAILIGISNAFSVIRKTKNGELAGTRPSNSLLEFVFLNK